MRFKITRLILLFVIFAVILLKIICCLKIGLQGVFFLSLKRKIIFTRAFIKASSRKHELAVFEHKWEEHISAYAEDAVYIA